MDLNFVELNDTFKLIYEDKSPSISAINNSDQITNATNKILRPLGVVIQDTINNPIFKIPSPLIDTAKFDLPDIKEFFYALYSKFVTDYLPWHYVVEMIRGEYYFFQTRPLDIKYPFDNNYISTYIKENKIKVNDKINKFLINQPFEIKDSIHICIIGDSSKDVYLDDIYYFMGKMVIAPILRINNLSKHTKLLNFNLGNKFKFHKLETYINIF